MKYKIGDVVRTKSGRRYKIMEVREKGAQWRGESYIARQTCGGGDCCGPFRVFKESAFEPVNEREKS